MSAPMVMICSCVTHNFFIVFGIGIPGVRPSQPHRGMFQATVRWIRGGKPPHEKFTGFWWPGNRTMPLDGWMGNPLSFRPSNWNGRRGSAHVHRSSLYPPIGAAERTAWPFYRRKTAGSKRQPSRMLRRRIWRGKRPTRWQMRRQRKTGMVSWFYFFVVNEMGDFGDLTLRSCRLGLFCADSILLPYNMDDGWGEKLL